MLIAAFCLFLPAAVATPNGAPCSAMKSADMMPEHGARPQKTPSPFKLLVADAATGEAVKEEIHVGKEYKVTIDYSAKASMKGFILRAMYTEPKNPDAGEFIAVPECVRLVKLCTIGGHYVTHRKPIGSPGGCKAEPLTLRWNTPSTSKPEQRVFFQATVVQDYKTFWTNITTTSYKLKPSDKGNGKEDLASILALVDKIRQNTTTTSKAVATPAPSKTVVKTKPATKVTKPTPPTTTTTLPAVTSPKFNSECGVEDGPDCLGRYQRDLKRTFCGIEGWPDYCPQLCCGYVNETMPAN